MSVPDYSPLLDDRTKLVNFEVLRNNSELVRAECSELMLETKQTCKRLQNDDTKRLDQRVKDIQFLKKELELKLEEIIVEIDYLIAIQSRVEKALVACTKTLKVSMVCVEERKKHFPYDRPRDEVDRELLKEIEVGEGVASLLQRVLEQITEQIRLDRSAKYYLEKDLKEKFQAQCIDNSCILMTQHSLNNLQRSKNPETVLPSFEVTPKQWENFSDINIHKAEQQLANSLSLRALVKSLLEQTAADLLKQVQATAAAFQLNVQELKSIKSQMENQLAANLSEFARQQRIWEDLQVAIAESEQARSLALARLTLRRERPGKELCHDPAQSQLLAEVRQLNAHIDTLHEAAAQSEEEQRSMLRSKLELQEGIQIKANSLYIDEVICATHREPIVIHCF